MRILDRVCEEEERGGLTDHVKEKKKRQHLTHLRHEGLCVIWEAFFLLVCVCVCEGWVRWRV